MFDFIRTHRRWMQLILLLLVVPAFAFFGIEGYVGFMSRDKELATIDGAAITQPEFDAARRARLEELRGMLGAQFDAQAIDTPTFRERLLNEMIDQRVIAAAAMQGRYSISDEQLRATIAGIPAVQENGAFSPERYRQVLAAQGMTPTDFELRVRSDLILAQVLGPIGATAGVPSFVLDRLMTGLTQERMVSLRRFNASGYSTDVQVTEQEIKEWYDKNLESLRLPESVDLEYIVVDETAASKGVSVPDAEVLAYYQQNQARFGQPEQRRVSHILREVGPNADQATKDAAKRKAQEIADQLKADPSQFAELAKTLSQDPGSSSQGGDLGWISKDTLVPEVETVVFQLKQGQISEVIESPFGYHVGVVNEIQPASVKPLEQVRDEIIAEVKRQMASVRFAELATSLTNLVYDQRDALEPIAKQLDLPLKKAQGLSRGGLLPDDLFSRAQPLTASERDTLNNPKVIQVAFSPDVLVDKFNSGVIEVQPGIVLTMRVDKINPSSIPALAQVSDLIKQRLIQERSLAMAREAGKAALAVIADGSQAPLGFTAAEVISRRDARNLTQSELQAAMNLPSNQVPKTIGIETPEGYTLIEVKSVAAGKALPEASQAQLKQQLGQAWARSEELAALQILRKVYRSEITPDGRAIISGEGEGTGTGS